MKTDKQGDTVNEPLRELLVRCGAGDGEAVGELVRRFRSQALSLAAALLDDRDLAEDAVQEAFLAALIELPKLREPEAFPAWFRQIVRTRCNRIVRRRTELPLDDAEERTCERESPESRVEREELRLVVRDALRRLPPAERETAELFYLAQRDCADVASLLRIPGATVRRRLHDARSRLRGMLLGYVGPVASEPKKETKKRRLPK